VQGLQNKLLDRLHGHRTHGGPLHCLGDSLGGAEVAPVAFEEGFDVLGRQQSNIMAYGGERS
jgi:hypothetical protein